MPNPVAKTPVVVVAETVSDEARQNAERAALAANSAIANAAIVAAAVTENAADKVETIHEETVQTLSEQEQRLASWLEENNQRQLVLHSETRAEIAPLRAEMSELKTGLSSMLEAVNKLLIPPSPSQPVTVKPETVTPPNVEGAAPLAAETGKQKRKIRLI